MPDGKEEFQIPQVRQFKGDNSEIPAEGLLGGHIHHYVPTTVGRNAQGPIQQLQCACGRPQSDDTVAAQAVEHARKVAEAQARFKEAQDLEVQRRAVERLEILKARIEHIRLAHPGWAAPLQGRGLMDTEFAELAKYCLQCHHFRVLLGELTGRTSLPPGTRVSCTQAHAEAVYHPEGHHVTAEGTFGFGPFHG